MRFASVCSGILGAELAWEPLGWEPAWCAEIDPFASRVIADRRPRLENHGDFTKIGPESGPVDLLGGGTPCQEFSQSRVGSRRGLDSERGNLALEFAALAARVQARWVVWENVPGVLSCGIGTILGALVQRGFGVAYRVLDAKHFGVPQARRRVFAVGHSGGDWRPSAAVLFERPDVPGHTRARQEAGTPFAGSATRSPRRIVSQCLGSSRGDLDGAGAYVAFDLQQITSATNRSNPKPGAPAPTLCSAGRPAVASQNGSMVRRLTPLEFERLQGFPDGWTAIPGASDTARYRALGNAWPVPVARWIGERISLVEKILGGVA